MRLPASRVLSRQLKVSRNIVKNAYHDLRSHGYLSSAGTRGTFVRVHIAGRRNLEFGK
ncbi:GntR family transcriptional regulator [Roseovarius sp. Pro17]|uniref:GntR family transcriptional regulator n=1 Tax=Roseovarius sp. Pro17 TaxID=3108175 RepID=UPI003A7F5E17